MEQQMKLKIMKTAGYNFQKLVNARGFVNHCSKPHFIFELPEGGYLVVNAHGANELWNDGHEDVK
jgi:hypothetical protein